MISKALYMRLCLEVFSFNQNSEKHLFLLSVGDSSIGLSFQNKDGSPMKESKYFTAGLLWDQGNKEIQDMIDFISLSK